MAAVAVSLTPEEQWEYAQQCERHPQDNQPYPDDEPYPGEKTDLDERLIDEAMCQMGRLVAERDAAVARAEQAEEKARSETYWYEQQRKITEDSIRDLEASEARVAALEAAGDLILDADEVYIDRALRGYDVTRARSQREATVRAWRALRGQAT